jgi:hypothetical protein
LPPVLIGVCFGGGNTAAETTQRRFGNLVLRRPFTRKLAPLSPMAGLSLSRRPCFDQGMAHGAPIRIETLGDLVAHDYILNAMCERCRHRVDLDMQALIDKLGEGFIYVGRTLDGRLVCSGAGRTT